MATALIAMQWENYAGGPGAPGIFASAPLTFNSRQDRLSALGNGDVLWLVSRCPDDHQYYFVGMLHVLKSQLNEPTSANAQQFGPFSIKADPDKSIDLGRSFPAEGLLRAFQFENGHPIKYGANLGQS